MYEDDDDALDAVQAALRAGTRHHNAPQNRPAPYTLPIDETDYYGYEHTMEGDFGGIARGLRADYDDTTMEMGAGDSSWGPADDSPTLLPLQGIGSTSTARNRQRNSNGSGQPKFPADSQFQRASNALRSQAKQSRYAGDPDHPPAEYEEYEDQHNYTEDQFYAPQTQAAPLSTLKSSSFAHPSQRASYQQPRRYPHGIEPVPTNRLPDRYRAIFPFLEFNPVQSKVFSSVFESDENLVVSSPTGSGKTVVFELAIIRLMETKAALGGNAQRDLSVYIAPTKALCNERYKDWSSKFSRLGLECVEFTGDTDNARNYYNRIKTADIIITTPEKWDSLTRRQSSNSRFTSRLGLLLIDEVHILNEKRGATLEVVVSRMKTKREIVRMIALSATVPNVEDVARWLGSSFPVANAVYEAGGQGSWSGNEQMQQMPMAKVYKFGEEFRPVKLTRFVYGYQAPNGWALQHRVEAEIYPLLLLHAHDKPVLVFCPTRKACNSMVEGIRKRYVEERDRRGRLPWQVVSGPPKHYRDKKIDASASVGIAPHHAGLDYSDRISIEEGFKSGSIKVIVCTSTLAVGVNLPAHTVIVAGTKMWDGTNLVEYQDIEVQQMFGRAGRPQFDDSGTAVVMCEQSQEHKYKDLLCTSTILESCLHESLTEHLNSEIGLGTINSIDTAHQWIKTTFLYIRIQRNPRWYSKLLSQNAQGHNNWQKALEDFITAAIKQLSEQELVETSRSNQEEQADQPETLVELQSTPFGIAMSSCCLRFGTMVNILKMQPNASMRALLEIFALAEEFADLKLRAGEKAIYNAMNQSAEIRYQLPNKVSKAQDKVFLLAQMTFGNVSLEDYKTKDTGEVPNSSLDVFLIFKSALRIVKAMVTVALERKDGGSARNALELLRTVNGKAWENSATVFRQIEAIGSKSIKALAVHGITSFGVLRQTDARRLEVMLNRNPPFGSQLLDNAGRFPQFDVIIKEKQLNEAHGKTAVQAILEVRVTSNRTCLAAAAKMRKGENLTISAIAVLSDGGYVTYRRIAAKSLLDDIEPIIMTAEFQKPSQRLLVIVGVDQIAGCTQTVEYKPAPLHPDAFPVLIDTRPTHEEETACQANEGEHPNKDVMPLEENHEAIHTQLPPPRPSIVLPRRLPNGNWACSHTCGAKGKACKHVCCRDGVKNKPKLPRIDIDQTPQTSTLPGTANSAREDDNVTPLSEETNAQSAVKAASRKSAMPEFILHVDSPPSDDLDDLPPLVPEVVPERTDDIGMDGDIHDDGIYEMLSFFDDIRERPGMQISNKEAERRRLIPKRSAIAMASPSNKRIKAEGSLDERYEGRRRASTPPDDKYPDREEIDELEDTSAPQQEATELSNYQISISTKSREDQYSDIGTRGHTTNAVTPDCISSDQSVSLYQKFDRQLPLAGENTQQRNEIDDLLLTLMDYVPGGLPASKRLELCVGNHSTKLHAPPKRSSAFETSMTLDSARALDNTSDLHVKQAEQVEYEVTAPQKPDDPTLDLIMADWDDWFNSDSVTVV